MSGIWICLAYGYAWHICIYNGSEKARVGSPRTAPARRGRKDRFAYSLTVLHFRKIVNVQKIGSPENGSLTGLHDEQTGNRMTMPISADFSSTGTIFLSIFSPPCQECP